MIHYHHPLSFNEYGSNFEFPKKKLLGNINWLFMARRQTELQVDFYSLIILSLEKCKR